MPINFKSVRSTSWLIISLMCLLSIRGGWASEQASERVVSLAPHLTELAYAAGAGSLLVGVVAYSDYPPEARKLPIIGDAFRFDLETIVSVQPTTALAWSGGTPQAVGDQLSSLGIDVIWIDTHTLDDIAGALVQIGQLTTDPTLAQQAADEFRASLDQWQQRVINDSQTPAVRVFYQISDRPLYTFGGRHVINEVFSMCGAVNIFQHIAAEALQVDLEAVLDQKPDYILAGVETHPSESDPWAHWRPHTQRALSHTQFHTMDPNLLVRPTLRIVEGIEALCELLTTSNARSHD